MGVVTEVMSHIVSGLVALVFFAIAAGGLLAVAAVCGPMDRGRPISLLPGMIGMVSMGAPGRDLPDDAEPDASDALAAARRIAHGTVLPALRPRPRWWNLVLKRRLDA